MLGPFPELLLSPGVWIVKLVGFLLRLIGPALHYKHNLFNRILLKRLCLKCKAGPTYKSKQETN